MTGIHIHPSILSADFARLADEIARVQNSDAIHVDVMDNHFVPNLTMGTPVVQAIRAATDKPLDIHLMIEDADRWAPDYADLGAESVTFHVEASKAPIRLARELRARGTKASMALKPATPIEPYMDMLTELDMILLMTVEPDLVASHSSTSSCQKSAVHARQSKMPVCQLRCRSMGESPPIQSNVPPRPEPMFSWPGRRYIRLMIQPKLSTSCALWHATPNTKEPDHAVAHRPI